MIKVISIWQPYASLAAHGFKKFETRAWPAPQSLIGTRIGIASTKQIKPAQREAFENIFFIREYVQTGLPSIEELPFGCVLASATLSECILMDEAFVASQSMAEKCFGVWASGRYAWKLTDLELFNEPHPAQGQQGFWNFEIPRRSSRSRKKTKAPLRNPVHVS